MEFWLLKVEPSSYSWQSMVSDKVTTWNGIHNHQAQKYLKSMKLSDLAFFYHTEKEKAIVGIVKICREYYYNDDSKFGVVDVEYVEPLSNLVTLARIKQNLDLQGMLILKQPRLSVSPVSQKEWDIVLQMGAR